MHHAIGIHVEDSMTGFVGVTIARTEYMNGCVQFLVQPEGMKPNGSPMDAEWFDEQRLNISSGAGAGGPQITPPGPGH